MLAAFEANPTMKVMVAVTDAAGARKFRFSEAFSHAGQSRHQLKR